MLTNFHTHTTFCDGKNTPEEVVLRAIEKGFTALGFSGHGYTEFDPGYCLRDTEGYIREIRRLQEKYRDKLKIYLGIEEDLLSPVNRGDYAYMIGSSHYLLVDGKYYSVDSGVQSFHGCMKLFGDDVLAYADRYYSVFCDYILRRKPDIVGHFDLITKFDEMEQSCFLENPAYLDLAEGYLLKAMESGAIFEVNTGAISRGYRKSVYPCLRLLHLLKKYDAKIILSSDSHSADTLDFYFAETKQLLRDVGFIHTYTLSDDGFVKVAL